MSIKTKLRAIMMLTSAIALLLACVAFMAVDLAGMRHQIERDMTILADVMGENVSTSIVFHDADTARQTLATLHGNPSLVVAIVHGSDGHPFVHYRAAGSDLANARMSVTRPILFGGETVGRITLASDLREIRHRVKTYAASAAGILLVALLVAFTLASRLQRVISTPILNLASVMGEVQRDKNYTLRAQAHSARDEVGALIHGFNDMLAEIQHRDDDVSRHKQMILDTAGEGIFGLDARGIVTFINPAGARMLGVIPGALLGRNLHDMLHPRDRAPIAAGACNVCSSVIAAPRISRVDTFLDRSGRAIPVEYTASAMRADNGTSSGVVVTFRDISERLAVDRMKDEFVSTVSHELRTPLTSIRGALGILASGLIGKSPERAQRMLDIAVSNTDRLVRLINDILDLERIASGRVELNRKTIDAAELITQAAESMQTLADRAGVTLIAQPEPAELRVDVDRILQTLTNLLSNAIKFSPRDSEVRISGEATASDYTFVVRDDGRGIPPEKLEMIFERFKQVDASDSRDKGGTGLGLAISRSIAAAHGGTIRAESTLGAGSTFRFALPFAMAESVSRGTVLLCEASGIASANVIGVIQRHGFGVLQASPCSELPRRAAESKPAAILLDLFPADGRWKLVEQIKRDERTRDIPMIVASMEWPRSLERDAKMIAGWVHAQPIVLLVEDDLDLAGVIATTLQAHGISTLHAANGRAALDLCSRVTPDMAILDVVLPELDGFAVVDWMKRDRALSRLPLLVYSAQEVGAHDQERLRLGPTEFLTKSRVSPEQFEQHVVRLLRQLGEQEVSGAA